MLTSREFLGAEFYGVCQREYDTARAYLKNCGKPKDDIDRFFIQKYKDDVKIFGWMLDMTNRVRLVDQKAKIIEEIKALKIKLGMKEKFLSTLN